MNIFFEVIFVQFLCFIDLCVISSWFVLNLGLFNCFLYGNHLNRTQYLTFECLTDLYGDVVIFCPALCSLVSNADDHMPVPNQEYKELNCWHRQLLEILDLIT